MAKADRGFASMDAARQREIARRGGEAAHRKGTAHEWTPEEARAAGRKGGAASHQKRRERRAALSRETPEAEKATQDEDGQPRAGGASGAATPTRWRGPSAA